MANEVKTGWSQFIYDFAKTTECLFMNCKHCNALKLSGWVLQKPKIITKEKTGKRSATFIVYQINQEGDKSMQFSSFPAITYINDYISLLEQQSGYFYINCVCSLVKSKYGLSAQVVALDISIRTDFPLKPTFERD